MDTSNEGNAELRSRIRQQEAVTEFGQQALETDDLDELLDDALTILANTLDINHCQVLELLPDEGVLILRENIGWPADANSISKVPTTRNSQAGSTIISMEPIVIEDLADGDPFASDELLQEQNIVSGLTVPIGSNEPPWGVLGAFTSEQTEFTECDASFLQSIANTLAAAIDRIQKEQQLQEREKQLDVATDAASIGIWNWDIQNDVVTADEFLAESYGIDSDVASEGAPMETFFEPIHEEDTEETREQLEQALETGDLDAEYRVRSANGDIMWMVARGKVEFDESGDPVQLNGAITEITDRKQREEALKESEERYRDLFNSMSEGYCVIERIQPSPEAPIDFRYVEANPAFEANTGIESVVGQTLRGVVPKTPQKWVDTYNKVVETGEAIRFERELVAQGRTLECYAFPVGDESKEQVGVVFTDITNRVDHEQRLEELIEKLEESNERLEQFAYAASHDLQEPLRMVTSYLQLVENRYAADLDEDAKEFIEFAVDGADRMRRMIDGLLQYSRVETQGDPFDQVDVNDIIDDVLADLQVKIEENNAEITVADMPRITGDRGQVHQLFQNLIDNAIEYSGTEPPQIHITAECDESKCRFAVHDEGIGIDSEAQDRIFEVFQRLHTQEEHSGTGIGLALCKRIVERHDGEIWIDSAQDEGTTFSFTLPSSTEPED